MPGDGAAEDLVAVVTVVELPAALVDGPVPDVRDLRPMIGRLGASGGGCEAAPEAGGARDAG